MLPRPFSITGHDHASIVSYVDVLQNKASVGEQVAIIGAGGIGFDVAEYLLHDGSQTPEEFCEEWGIDRTLSNRGGIKSVFCILIFVIFIYLFRFVEIDWQKATETKNHFITTKRRQTWCWFRQNNR